MDYMQLLSSLGRNGDTMLAHINPQEAQLLKSLGGAGTTNPETGLPEFYDAAGMGGAPADAAAEAAGPVDIGTSDLGGLVTPGGTGPAASKGSAGLIGNIVQSEGLPEYSISTPFGKISTTDMANAALNFGTNALIPGAGLVSGLVGGFGKGMGLLGGQPAGPSDMYPGGNPAYGPGGPLSSMQAGGANLAAGMGGTDYNGLPASIPSVTASTASTSPATSTPASTSTTNLAYSLGIDANVLDMLLRSGVSQI